MKWRLLAALCLAGATAQAAAVKRYITLDGTRLLMKPAAFSKTLGVLDKGQMVFAEQVAGGYYKVKVEPKEGQLFKKNLGFIHGRALQVNKPKVGSFAKQSGDASAEEVAAATKGFNKQVEAEYKAKNAKLDYELVDRLEARTKRDTASAEHQAFKSKGKLGEFSDANKGGADE